MMGQTTPALSVQNLCISYRINGQWLRAVRDFQIEVCPGQIVGLVGESGSGKSTAAAGIMGYLADNGRIEPGSAIYFMGENLAAKSRREMARIWGARLGMVPQNPGAALNPSMRVGEQVAEILRRHKNMDKAAAHAQTVEMFQRVRLSDPEGTLRRYPHELSGGMQQRVVIAMALSTAPQLLILDEPTTNLDVTTEAVILDLVRDLIRAEGEGALYVTHNLGVVAQLCERVVVMYAGEIVEEARTVDLFDRPLHPYTMGLLNSVPRLGQTKHRAELLTIPGRAPSLIDLPPGCVFVPRCPFAIELCQTRPPLVSAGDGRTVRCHRWPEIANGTLSLAAGRVNLQRPDQVRPERESLLNVQGLTRHFPVRRTVGEWLRRAAPAPVRAVDGVNLGIQKGRTLGLVGESGSGKTTLARLIIGLEDRTAGKITLTGADVVGNVRERGRAALAQLQMIFQNPQDSLNPYLTVGQAIRRPLITLAGQKRAAADQEVLRLLRVVNLSPDYAARYPGELSGGEKQRVAIARAFASNPALIICDEPVSSLDVSVQATVLNLLAHLQDERDTSYLFISHDLAVVGYLADYLAVMYLGELFEVGYGSDLFRPPYHPYTEALVAAIPRLDPRAETPRARLSDDLPNPRHMPSGCRFHTRCPHKLGAICEQTAPPWRDDGDGHWIRCHIPLDDLAARQQGLITRGES
jgi:peptide/nickel transport system ATP-binding protein